MHNRSMFRRYVRHVDLGELGVNEVWHGDTMLYPENTSLIYKLQVITPKAGTLEWAYWLHAVRAVTYSNNLYDSNAQMQLEGISDQYWLGANRPTGLYQASIAEDGWITFRTDEGPCVSDIRDGDTLTISANIQEHYDVPHTSGEQDVESSARWFNPYLPGTFLKLWWGKGQKKKSAGVRYAVNGYPSNTQMIAGAGQKNGHGRGITVYAEAYPTACHVCNTSNPASGNDDYVPGDTGLTGSFQQFNSCYSLKATPTYPKFEKVFKLKVKNIIIQSIS